MSLRPVQPLQAAPLLPLVAAKLRRTPAARLACVCRWVAPASVRPCAPDRALATGAVLARAIDVREAVDLRLALALLDEDRDVRAVWLRPLGRGLLVDRLVCGVVAGTTVTIDAPLDCEESIDVLV